MSKYMQLLEIARSCIGIPYLYGGTTTKGFDCSGMCQYIYKQLGIDIPRTTYEQIKVGVKITDKSKLKTGDLIFNIDSNGSPYHVFIYTENGKVIEAKKTGTLISEHGQWLWHDVAIRIFEEETLEEKNENTVEERLETALHYRVVSGSYNVKTNAVNWMNKLIGEGFDSFLEFNDNKYRVICGSFTNKAYAIAQQEKLKQKGFDSFLDIYYK